MGRELLEPREVVPPLTRHVWKGGTGSEDDARVSWDLEKTIYFVPGPTDRSRPTKICNVYIF